MVLTLTPAHIAKIISHVCSELPCEACGLLGGYNGKVVTVYRARNADRKPNRFFVDPRDHFRAIRAMERRSQKLVGIFHSHPEGTPFPSKRDRDLAAYPGVVNLIVATGEDIKIRAFLFDKGQVTPVQLIIEGKDEPVFEYRSEEEC